MAASRTLWVTISKPHPVRNTRSRASARTSSRSLRRGCRWARRRARAAASPPARDRSQPVAAGRRTIARDSGRAAAQPEPIGEFGLPGGIMPAGDAGLESEVVPDIQARDQVELLEDQSEPVTAQLGAARIGQSGDGNIGKPDLAAVGAVQSRDQVQQCALAAAGPRSARRARLPQRWGSPRAAPRSVSAGAIALGEFANAQHGCAAGRHAGVSRRLTSASDI